MKKLIPILIVLLILICPIVVSADRIEDTYTNSTDLSISGWNYSTTANNFEPSAHYGDQYTFLRGSANTVNVTANKPNDNINWLILYYHTEVPIDMNSLAIFVKLKRGNTVIESPLIYIYGTENERFGYYLMNNNNNMNGYSLYITTQKSGDFAICCPMGTGNAVGFTIECYVRKYDNLGNKLNGIATTLEQSNERLSNLEAMLYKLNYQSKGLNLLQNIIVDVSQGNTVANGTDEDTLLAGNSWEWSLKNMGSTAKDYTITYIFTDENITELAVNIIGGVKKSYTAYFWENGTVTNVKTGNSNTTLRADDNGKFNRFVAMWTVQAGEEIRVGITRLTTTDNATIQEIKSQAEIIETDKQTVEEIQNSEISYKIVDENGNETAETMSINNFQYSLMLVYGQTTNWMETTGVANQIKTLSKEFEKILQLDWIKHTIRISMILMILPFFVGMISKGAKATEKTERSSRNDSNTRSS